MDAASHLLGMRVQESRPLRADEHTAVETRQRDPLGIASRPRERLERRLAACKEIIECPTRLETLQGVGPE